MFYQMYCTILNVFLCNSINEIIKMHKLCIHFNNELFLWLCTYALNKSSKIANESNLTFVLLTACINEALIEYLPE